MQFFIVTVYNDKIQKDVEMKYIIHKVVYLFEIGSYLSGIP